MTYSYWWPFLWMLVAGVICLFVNMTRVEKDFDGREVLRWRWLPAILLVLPLVLLATFRPLNFGDSGVYRASFENTPSTLVSFGSFLETKEKDLGYSILEITFRSVISKSYLLFFLFIAIVQAACLLFVFRKCTPSFWFAFFLFVASSDYYSWMHNGTRQFIAVAIVFATLPLIVQKKYFWAILLVLLASTIHLTALLALPVMIIAIGKPWNWRTIIFLLGVILIIEFVNQFTDILIDVMEDTQYSAEAQQLSTSTGTNIFRVVFYSIPTIASFFFRKRIAQENNRAINICVNMSIASMGIYIISHFTSGLLIGRLPIYFSLANYILIPWMIEEFFEKRSAIVIKIGFIALYSVFYYYQVGLTWGLL